ncbi:Uncharacterised protein [Mycobacterium tuberculosis]|nr:Uncharacterised protein [Mycobacterium tuberculosis]CNV31214.1 Uncharacterised protein [Mycobacterium tuberculosis]
MVWFSELIALGRLSVTNPTPPSTFVRTSCDSPVTGLASPEEFDQQSRSWLAQRCPRGLRFIVYPDDNAGREPGPTTDR